MNGQAKILAIETSCDETAIALLEGSNFNNLKILGNTVSSQAKLHAEFGGVYPSLAKREHAKNIVPVLIETLNQAGINTTNKIKLTEQQEQFLKNLFSHEPELYEIFIKHIPQIETGNITHIGVTTGPGLAPALWVGVNFAKALNYVWNISIISVNHMEGHVLSPLLTNKCELPALALLISGGHTEIIFTSNFGQYKKIGKTLDDAVGEAYDKVARLLDLPYPGGPEIAKLASLDRLKNNKAVLDLPKPMINSGDLNMSFSGLKTAVLYMVQRIKESGNLNNDTKQNIARAFEDSITTVLVKKILKAIEAYPVKTILVGGGVSANEFIKKSLTEQVKKNYPDIVLLFPNKDLSTDNAIMIGMTTALKINKQDTANNQEIIAESNWELG